MTLFYRIAFRAGHATASWRYTLDFECRRAADQAAAEIARMGFTTRVVPFTPERSV